MLVGRKKERARLRAVIERLRAGRGGAVVLRGEPGIGKTALLEDLRDAASGVRILGARPVESEARLAFAGLADIVRPVLEYRAGLPEAQRVALEAALALGPPAVPDRFAAYAGALGLLSTAASQRPVLILVDDAQWLDGPSQEALLFVARRLDDDPVALVATSRETPAEDLDLSGVEEIRIHPLASDEARRVLAAGEHPLAPEVRDALLGAAGGNPLALVELPRALSPQECAGRVPLPATLPPGEALTRAFRDRFRGLGPGALTAALAVALSEDGSLTTLVRVLAPLGAARSDLRAAEKAGVVVLHGQAARMAHPVLRGVVLGLVGAEDQRSVHRAIAAALEGDGAQERRAWHLAAAAVGPDEEAARALDAAAASAAARTGYAAAASALERASGLSSEPAAAAARRLGAARMALTAGRPAWSRSLLEETGGLAPDLRAEAGHLRGILTMRTSDFSRAAGDVVREGEAVAGTDPARAAVMIADAVLAHALAGDCRAALRTARRAHAVALSAPAVPPSVLGYLGYALTLSGAARQARSLLDELDRASACVDPLTPEGQALALSQVWRIWIGDFDREFRRLEQVIERARSACAVGFLGYPLAWGCELSFRAGLWDRAAAYGEEALGLLTETGQGGFVSYALCALGMVDAGRGRVDAARAGARAALERAQVVGAGSVQVYAASVVALAAAGEGDAEDVVDACSPLAGAVDEDFGLREPGTVPWQPDLIEALARLGRIQEARRCLATLAEQADVADNLWARAATCRCRGLIDGDIDRHFGRALALHSWIPTPFERARTQLAYGFRLRRARRPTDAREQLRRALATFDELGARAWSGQARDALAASGARPRARGREATRDQLSARELQVALAVARGATNREAAARLFVSEKTIERRLGNVYRKLGLRSRSELARRFATSALGADGPPSPGDAGGGAG